MSVRKKLKQQQQQQRHPQRQPQPQLIQVLPQELQHHLQHLQQQQQQQHHPQLHQYNLQHQQGHQQHVNNNDDNNNNVHTTVRVYPHHYYYNPTMLNQSEQQQPQHSQQQEQQQQFSRRQQRFFVASKPTEVLADCHSEDISNLLELSDGTLLTTSYDRSIKRWTRQGQHLQSFFGHAEGVLGITQIDERTIASCSIDRMVRFWDLETAKNITSLDGHQLAVHCVLKLRHQHQYEDLTRSFERNRPLATSSSSVWTASESGGTEGRGVFDKKKTMVVTGSMDSTIRIYILEDQTLLTTFHEHTSTVRALCELKDGTLISGSHDCTVKVWNLREWRCERTLRGHSSWVLAVVPIGSIYDDDEDYDCCGGGDDDNGDDDNSDDDDESEGLHRRSSYGDQDHPSGIRRGRQRSSSSSSSSSESVGGDARRKMKMKRKKSSQQSIFVASSSVDETIMIWNVKTGECIRTLVGHSNPIEALYRLNNADRKPVSQHSHQYDRQLRRHRHPRLYDKLKQYKKKLDLERMRMRANPREGEYDEQQQHHIDLNLINDHHNEQQQQQPQHQQVGEELNDVEVADASDDNGIADHEEQEEEEEDEEEDQLRGELLASGSADGEVRVWDARTGECLDACMTGGRVIALIGLRGEVSCSIATTVNGWEHKQKNVEIRRIWNRQRSLVHASSWVVARNCASDAMFESLKRVLPDEVFQLLSLCYQHLRPSYVPPQHILSSSSSSPSLSLSKTPTPTYRTTSSSTSTSPSPSSYSQQHQQRPLPPSPHNHNQ